MSEPGWNPSSESGSSLPQDLSQAKSQDQAGATLFPSVDDGSGRVERVNKDRDSGDLIDTSENDGNEDDTEGSGESEGGVRIARISAALPGVDNLHRRASLAAIWVFYMICRYPRAALASGLSTAILGAVVLFQPGKGKDDATTANSNTRSRQSGHSDSGQTNPPNASADPLKSRGKFPDP